MEGSGRGSGAMRGNKHSLGTTDGHPWGGKHCSAITLVLPSGECP